MKNFRSSRHSLSRLLAGLLCAALCAGLALSATACAQKAPQNEPQPGVTYTNLLSATNRQVAASLSDEVAEIYWAGTVAGHITLCARGERETDADERPWLLVEVDAEKEDYSSVTLTLAPVSDTLPQTQAALADPPTTYDLVAGYAMPVCDVIAVVADADGQLYLLQENALYHYSQSASGESLVQVLEREVLLCSLDEGGALHPTATLQLPEEYQLAQSFSSNCLLAADQTLWLTAFDLNGPACLLRFSLADGSLRSTLPLPEGVTPGNDALVALSGDRLLLGASLFEGTVNDMPTYTDQFWIVENSTTEKPTLAPQALPLPSQLFTTGKGNFVISTQEQVTDVVTMFHANGVSAWNTATGEVETLLTWKDLALKYYDVRMLFALQDGRYLAVMVPPNAACQLRILTPLAPDALDDREVLTFAKQAFSTEKADCIQQVIDAFNASSEEYYIQVVDYTPADKNRVSTLDLDEAQQRLTEDILQGQMPDIVMVNAYSMSALSGSSLGACLLNKDLFIDLYPWIDADPELKREDFLPGILQATQVGDTLPTIVPVYNIRTVAGASQTVGPHAGWTLEEYNALRAQNPELIYGASRQMVLFGMVQSAGSQLIDWQTRQAHLDTPQFVELLAATASQPELLYTGETLDVHAIQEEGIARLLWMDMESWGHLNTARYIFGQDYTFKGLPTTEGNGSAIVPRLRVGISSTCQHPDVAWQLVRNFLLPEFQDKLDLEAGYTGFPLRQDSLQKIAQAVQSKVKKTVYPSSYFPPEEMNAAIEAGVFDQPLTAQDTDKLIDLIQNLDHLWNIEPPLFDILAEEADAFYYGQRSAEDAAKIIQDRVQTYLDEQG